MHEPPTRARSSDGRKVEATSVASHATLRFAAYASPKRRHQGGDGMHARARNVKTGLVAAAVAILLLVGAGVAYATGSGDDSSEQQATGPGIEKAKSVALEQTNGGRVTGTEIGDEEGYYEVEVIRDDGSQVDVHLDRDFNVLSTPADNESPDAKDAPNDSGG